MKLTKFGLLRLAKGTSYESDTGESEVALGEGERLLEHEYEIAADEWIGLGFRVDKGPVVLDDVFVNLVGK